VTETVLVHVSDLHFGVHADLEQLERLPAYLTQLAPSAIVVSGDLTQRARHGEFMAAHLLLRELQPVAPLLVMPGNHDVQWWTSPFGIFGQRPKYAKYRRYFGEDLTPVLKVPGAVIAAMLSSHGIAFGSLTWNPNDMTTIGHLPESEVNRVRKLYAEAPAGAIRVAVVHHNIVGGKISGRMGLARWRTAQRRLIGLGVELALSGHDHEEAATQIDGTLVVSTASTPTDRTRGHRPSVFNLIRIDGSRIQIEHHLWDPALAQFRQGTISAFARNRAAQSGV
jgi:3',5'-cyclic AMP phosphodiesterase CpdA